MFKKAICCGRVRLYRGSRNIARRENATIVSQRRNVARIFGKNFFRHAKIFSARDCDQHFTSPARLTGALGAGVVAS